MSNSVGLATQRQDGWRASGTVQNYQEEPKFGKNWAYKRIYTPSKNNLSIITQLCVTEINQISSGKFVLNSLDLISSVGLACSRQHSLVSCVC